MRRYAKLLRATVTASLMLVALVGAAVAGWLEDLLDVLEQRGDYATEYRLVSPLAEKGDAVAQARLGHMHVNGQGVSQDCVTAHIWLSLSGAQAITDAIKERDAVERHMTPAQIAEAQKLVA
jgi:TPR repeat protein